VSLLPGQQLSILAAGLLFDLDGVLVDSASVSEYAWGKWARAHGIDEQLVIRTMQGRRSQETVKIVAPHLDPEVEAARVTDVEVEESSRVRALPGARELVEQLREGEWTVVTSCPERLARVRLRAAGLPEPKEMITAERVSKGKPAPDPYAAGIVLLGKKPEYCVVFEDAPIGIISGRAAGARVIALRTGYPDEQLLVADFVVDSCANVGLGRSDGHLQLHLS